MFANSGREIFWQYIFCFFLTEAYEKFNANTIHYTLGRIKHLANEAAAQSSIFGDL